MVGQKNFKISAVIGFTMPTSSLQRQNSKSGYLEFDADKNSFIISFKQIRKTVSIPMNCIVQPTKELCPRGSIYTFDFNIRDFKYKQCFLRNMSDNDRKLLHAHIIRTVGVKRTWYNTSTSCAMPLGDDSLPFWRTKFVMPPLPQKVENLERVITPEPPKGKRNYDEVVNDPFETTITSLSFY